ncbi:MAG: hypothetical protein WD030_00560 [Pirellulales bacterium]
MKKALANFLTPRPKLRRRGMLTLEWILLLTVVVIGVIGGLAAVRDAILDELHDLQQIIMNLNP